MIYDYLDKYTFEYLMKQSLLDVPNTMDKRQGSIIYDALAPACYRMAALYLEMKQMYVNTFLETASNEYLDKRGAERGKYRTSPTYAVKRAAFSSSSGGPVSVEPGSRFCTISDTSPIYYVATSAFVENGVVVEGQYLLTCETAGTAGNQYTGPLLAVTYVQGLATATMSDLVTSAIEGESDESFRARCIAAFASSFGGNVSDYNDKLQSLTGIGDVQVYPAWNGGGTVKISVVNDDYRAVSQAVIDSIKETVDPTVYTGLGAGIAPIGHSVTIVTPQELSVNISATITLDIGYTLGQVQAGVVSSIEYYVSAIRKIWGTESPTNSYALAMYLSKVTVAILSVKGVANVTNLMLNSAASDINFTETSTTQQIPVLGTVTLS